MRNNSRGRYKGSRYNVFRIIFTGIIFFAILLVWLNWRHSWNGKSRFTTVVQNKSEGQQSKQDLAVISFDLSRKKGKFLLLKNNFYMDIPYGYKTYPVFSIYKLGELDSERSGGILLKKSVETTLGIKTDRYLMLDKANSEKLPGSREELLSFKQRNFSLFNGFSTLMKFLMGRYETDMSTIEKIRFFQAMRTLRIDQLEFIDLSHTQAALAEQLPDKSKIYTVDTGIFDFLFGTDFLNIGVRNEGVTLEVENATGVDKIATQFSRNLENLGANVILKTTAEAIESKACNLVFKTSESKNSLTGSILRKDYLCGEAKTYDSQAQADIKVIIGEGFLK